jgi:hypothetical protein
MKCKSHLVSASTTTQDTHTSAPFPGLNYRGPSQTLRSLQPVLPRRAGRGMIDLLSVDLNLEDVFAEHQQRPVQMPALAVSRLG